jgi:glyoxylase-like metal-dependent hydrolase (beta-lactamase superfamily II)
MIGPFAGNLRGRRGIMRRNGGSRFLLRYFLAGVIAGAAAWAGPAGGAAVSPVIKINQAAATAKITIEPVRGGISVLMGSGGNITVLSAKEGKLMVDAGIAVSQPRVEAALDKLGPGKVKYLINTHYHWDHTDGNKWVQASGATIIAHKNTLKHVSERTRVEDWNYTFEPLPVAARPKELVTDSKTISFAGSKVVMKNFGNGHTDSDIWVYFPGEDVLVLGDIFWNGVYPFIDNAHGGGINQAIRWADHAIKQCGNNTVVVPGHGPVGNRAQLVEFRNMLATIRDNVAALKKQGKSLDEVIAAKPTAAFDAKFGGFVIDPAFFTRLVYAGL